MYFIVVPRTVEQLACILRQPNATYRQENNKNQTDGSLSTRWYNAIPTIVSRGFENRSNRPATCKNYQMSRRSEAKQYVLDTNYEMTIGLNGILCSGPLLRLQLYCQRYPDKTHVKTDSARPTSQFHPLLDPLDYSGFSGNRPGFQKSSKNQGRFC
ncbi:MAG TPA: hypothetical protein DD473_17655, partial [Planctomycetaceae bacterium]|nr:hypothetical protein [Planctomycetaceae bacterium]